MPLLIIMADMLYPLKGKKISLIPQSGSEMVYLLDDRLILDFLFLLRLYFKVLRF